jgi:hypothetical protein
MLEGDVMAHDGPLRTFTGGQLDLFGGGPAPGHGPDPEEMREWLCSLLAEARAAETMPWPPVNTRLYRMLFPRITSWLPEDEGAQLRFEFEAELARLEAA